MRFFFQVFLIRIYGDVVIFFFIDISLGWRLDVMNFLVFIISFVEEVMQWEFFSVREVQVNGIN